MNNDWTPWTEDEYPSTTRRFDSYTATVQLVPPCQENGWGNRKWTVEHKYLDESGPAAVVGTGYTLGSKNAIALCEAVLHVWGVIQEAHELFSRAATGQYNPRHG